MFDLSQWGINNLLEDFVKKPIKITIENVSDRYIISGTLQVLKKKKGDEKDEHIPKSVRQDKVSKDTKVAEVSTKKRSRTNFKRDR